MNNLDKKKKEIQVKGLNKISKYFDLDTKRLERIKPEVLKHLYQMAKLGMQYEREMNVSKRAVESNYVKIGNIISESKEELKQYIKKSLPQYC